MYADDMVLLAPSWNALQSNTHWFTGWFCPRDQNR